MVEPPPVQNYVHLEAAETTDTLHDDAGVTRAMTVREKRWQFRSTIAFWASTFFLQGSVLFATGSIAMYPSVLQVCSEEQDHKTSSCQPEFLYKAWVDYSFMIGAWCFLIGNYAVYFQVINGHSSDVDVTKFKFVTWPDCSDFGHVGALVNVLGALAYNINTMLMFDTANHMSVSVGCPHSYGCNTLWSQVWYDYNLTYVLSGGTGSALFAIGAVCEAEHNNWRDCSLETLKKAPVIMAILNFIGAVLFLLAYIVEYHHYADNHEDILVWLVATPFTVGSVFFFIGSWMSLFMWKQQACPAPSSTLTRCCSRTSVSVMQRMWSAIRMSRSTSNSKLWLLYT